MSTNIFPRNDYNVEVCSHRWDKQMTFCDNCDTLNNNMYMSLMLWYFRNNIKVGLFALTTNQTQMEIASHLEKCGIVNNSVYCTMGSTNQKTMNENSRTMRETFKDYLSRYPSTFSYSGSDETYYKTAAQYFNGARDNDYGDFGHPYTFYGFNFQTGAMLGSSEVPSGYDARSGFDRYDEMKHFMSIRWCDEATGGKFHHGYTVAQTIQKVIDDVKVTYQNHGFYNAFCHWHMLEGNYSVTRLQYKSYIDALASVTIDGQNVSNNIHFCGFDEAFEYLVARTMLKKISCYTPLDNPDEIHIVGYFNNNVSPRFRLDSLNTPLTIKINTVGTPLEGKGITSSYGNVMNISSNVYLVELPVPRSGNISGVILSKAEGSDYINTSKPTISSSITEVQGETIVPFSGTIESFYYNGTFYCQENPASYTGEIIACSPGDLIRVKSILGNTVSMAIAFCNARPTPTSNPPVTPYPDLSIFISGVHVTEEKLNLLVTYEAVAPVGTKYAVLSSGNPGSASGIIASDARSIITFSCGSFKKELLNYCVFRKPSNSTENNAVIIDYKHNVNSFDVVKENGYEYAVGVTVNYDNGHYITSNVSSWT